MGEMASMRVADMTTSVVALRRKELEALGEYIAEVNTPWFAIRLRTWDKRVEIARRHGREGPNLILYARSDSPRHHWAIPNAIVRRCLEEAKPLLNAKDGLRWDFRIEGGKLEHSPKMEYESRDVSKFYGASLLVDTVPMELMEATADAGEFDRRVALLVKLPLERPEGQAKPRANTTGPRVTYERRPDVKAWVLQQARNNCELCGNEAPFMNEHDEWYLELHHVCRLVDGGPDTVENAVALCPNCHRRLHYSADAKAQQSRLYSQVARLRPVEPRKSLSQATEGTTSPRGQGDAS